MKTYSRLTLAFLLLILVVPQVGADAPHENGKEVLTWSDSSGKFKLEATFVELVDGNLVVLKRASDGKIGRVPLDRFSEESQKQALDLHKKLMKRARESFRDNFAATDNVEEKRRLANELIDQYAPKLKPSFKNFTGEGWDGALKAKGFEKMLSRCAVKKHDGLHGHIFEVQAARDITAAGLRIDSCYEVKELNGKTTEFDIRATDAVTDQKYNFEVKDWQKKTFNRTEQKLELLHQLERQKEALPDAVHVFFFNKAKKEIPSGVRQEIEEDAGFTIIARNNSPECATKLLKQLRAGSR
jgi:hypothetical protein